jgi:hypothetical protein
VFEQTDSVNSTWLQIVELRRIVLVWYFSWRSLSFRSFRLAVCVCLYRCGKRSQLSTIVILKDQTEIRTQKLICRVVTIGHVDISCREREGKKGREELKHKEKGTGDDDSKSERREAEKRWSRELQTG